VADDLGTDLDRLLLKARQQRVLDWLGRSEGTQEIAEIVAERVELKPSGVPQRTSGTTREFSKLLLSF